MDKVVAIFDLDNLVNYESFNDKVFRQYHAQIIINYSEVGIDRFLIYENNQIPVEDIKLDFSIEPEHLPIIFMSRINDYLKRNNIKEIHLINSDPYIQLRKEMLESLIGSSGAIVKIL